MGTRGAYEEIRDETWARHMQGKRLPHCIISLAIIIIIFIIITIIIIISIITTIIIGVESHLALPRTYS